MKHWLLAIYVVVASFSFAHVAGAEVNETYEIVAPEQQGIEQAQAVQILKGTPLYSDQALTAIVGSWQGDSQALAFELVNNVVAIQIAGVTLYVEASAVQPQMEAVENTEKSIGFVRLAKAVTIFEEANESAPLLQFEGNEIERIEVLGVEDKYFKVNVAGMTGYVLQNETFVDVKKALKVLKNTAVMDGKKNVATLTKNGVIQATSVVGDTYTINKKFTFTATDVVETDETFKWPAHFKQTYTVTLTAQKAAGLYDANGKKFAEIPAKSKVTLVNITDDYGVIRVFGTSVFIDMKDFKHSGLIAGEKVLTHHEMNYKLNVFAMLYPEFMELEEIGKSVEGRSILALTVGTGKKQILMDASMHAREHMTTNVLMEMVDTYSYHYIHNSQMGNYNVRNVLDRVKITFVPMLNPDGVTLVQGGKVSTPLATLKKLNGGSTNFKRWKANIRGVDLNRNWDVRWNKLPVIKPKWEMAKGPKPFSEPEAVALRDFVLKHPFKAYITYHSSGQIMFWEYGNGKGGKAKATALVKDLSKATGYTIMKNSQTSPTAASEPWVSKKLDIPGVTIEIAPYAGNGPVPLSRWNSVWKKNQTIGLLVANKAKGY